MPKKSSSINARIPDELRQRLDAIHRRHMTNDSSALIHSLDAFCTYVEREGKVILPMQMMPVDERAMESGPKKSSVQRAS
jgi:hypothetical protein